jgi:hypothetical protein
MTASLPTPLGPLITTINGPGLGVMGSELNAEPSEASRARTSSARSALSTEGMGTKGGRDIWEIGEQRQRGAWEIFGRNIFLGEGWDRELGNLKGKREVEEKRSLRNMEGGGECTI